MPVNIRMKRLYERLAAAGINTPFAKSILPGWWDDDMASTDAGYARGLGIISSHLTIDLAQLWDASAPITVGSFGKTNFKKNANVTETEVQWTKSVALSAARFAVQAIRAEFKPLPAATVIRDEILANGRDCVNLEALLGYLWGHGVPVLFVQQRPKGSKVMDGIVATIDGRPVIVLSKKKHRNSLMLFVLAHECGHIVRGHLNDKPILLDTKIDRSNDSDQQEKEANQSALEVLTGSPTLQFVHSDQYIDAESLASMARATASKTQIDPGVIVQNFAYGRVLQGVDKNIMFALANAACTILEGDKNPVGLIDQMFLKHVDLSSIADEHAEFLMNVAVTGDSNAVAAGH